MIEDILVCPVCHHDLPLKEIKANGKGKCTNCGGDYSYDKGFFYLIPTPFPDKNIQEKTDLWEKLQENGAISYSLLPETNLAVSERDEIKRFMEFSQIQGTVLDVGCGPQAIPSYAVNFIGRFVGIDPLKGSPEREFEFVNAVGEYLPFRDKTFDCVLFATTIDHFLDAVKVLSETRRVLKPGGAASIWFAEYVELLPPDTTPIIILKLRNAFDLLRHFEVSEFSRRLIKQFRKSKEPAVDPRVEYLYSLPAPPGAYNAFHSVRPTLPELRQWLTLAGLTISHETEPDHDGNIYVKAIRLPE